VVDHVGERGAGGAQGDEEVEPHGPLEVVVGELEEAVEAQPHGADVVDEDVEPAVVVDRPLDQLRWGARLAEIGGHSGDAVQPVQRLGAAGARDHAGALLGQPLGNRQADAGAGTRHYGHPVGEVEVHYGVAAFTAQSSA
jgi:hypothetical protein